jgi:hypothetical protein
MAGPGDEIAARAGGRGQLRASHADREQVIETLKVAFVQGMLDEDEFDLRVGQAFASRTCAELAALTADLPERLAVARPPRPERTRDEIMQRPGRMWRWQPPPMRACGRTGCSWPLTVAIISGYPR